MRNSSNSQAVAEFQGQYASGADLQKFFATFGLPGYRKGVDDVVSKFVGSPNNATSPQDEASLDVQYMMGVAVHPTQQHKWQPHGPILTLTMSLTLALTLN